MQFCTKHYILWSTDMVSMKTVAIRKVTRQMLNDRCNDELDTVDKVVNALLDECASRMDERIDMGRTNIWLNDETLERLKEFKAHPNESNNDILYRLLQSVNSP